MRVRVWAVVTLGTLGLVNSPAAPLDYAVAPPAPNLLELNLPAVSTNDLADSNSVRGLRDEAILAFQSQRYTDSLERLDQMAGTVNPAPNLQRLRAWAASYAGLDERAIVLWTALADATPGDALLQEMVGWTAFRLGRAQEASARYAQSLRLRPGESRLQLMAALSAWSEGRTAAAQRLLVLAMQNRTAPPESFVAMAALQSESGHYPETAGWLRRILPTLSPEQRRHWLSQSEFKTIAIAWPTGWRDLKTEFNVELAEEKPLSEAEVESALLVPATTNPPAEVSETQLHLSPFTGEPSLRMEKIRAYRMEMALRRLRAQDQITEEPGLGEYETLGTWR